MIPFLISISVGPILHGWVLSILWRWFMVPTFHLPTLQIPAAIGISLVVELITYHHVDAEPKNESATDKMFGQLSMMLFLPLYVLAFGWVVHKFQ